MGPECISETDIVTATMAYEEWGGNRDSLLGKKRKVAPEYRVSEKKP